MTTGSAPSHAPRARRSAAWGRGLVRLRWWFVGGWLAACLGSWFLLPSLSASPAGSNLAALVLEDTPAVATELRSVEVFGSRSAVGPSWCSDEADTTALTYLLFEPDVSFGVQTRTARRYAAKAFGPRDSVVGITGSVPPRALQGDMSGRDATAARLAIWWCWTIRHWEQRPSSPWTPSRSGSLG